MKIAIRYYTRSGNTKKLADAIGNELKIEAQDTSHKLEEDTDILFLGSSVYAYGVDDNIKKFINDIDVKVGIVINFSTAALINSTYKQVKKLLDKKNIPLAPEEFYCRGSFGPVHKGHPDENDLASAQNFAKEIIKKYKK